MRQVIEILKIAGFKRMDAGFYVKDGLYRNLSGNLAIGFRQITHLKQITI